MDGFIGLYPLQPYDKLVIPSDAVTFQLEHVVKICPISLMFMYTCEQSLLNNYLSMYEQ